MTMKDFDPNRKPFARGYFLEPYRNRGLIHPLKRESKVAYFRDTNPDGFWHDLGAMDVFLDNFGILMGEQFKDSQELELYAGTVIDELLDVWDVLKYLVLRRLPYWGNHFNSKGRQANAGEPRGLLRFLADDDLRNAGGLDWLLQEAEQGVTPFRHSVAPPRWHRLRERLEEHLQGVDRIDWHQNWSPEGLLPPDFFDSDLTAKGDSPVERPVLEIWPEGVILPPGHPREVDQLRILHPRHSTPDLPLRVGPRKSDLGSLESLVRNQGQIGTCVAHAVAVALDLLVQRQHREARKTRFSRSWIHCSTGEDGETGRTLGDAIEAIRQQLPCQDETFPYSIEGLRRHKPPGPAWKTDAMVRDSKALTERFGTPLVRKLDPKDIALMKAHLAAGWVVVVSTSLTEEFRGPGLAGYGLPLAPTPGQRRLKEGHAWLLFGYDHVDGNSRWKYQGRFLAMSSWGTAFPSRPDRGKGLCSLPFAFLLTEGIEAFALRFRT